MAKIKASAKLLENVRLVTENGRGQSVICDLPEASGGTNSGPTPLELCVMSHAGCYATICALTAQKMRLPLKGCDVKVEAVKSPETGTISEESFDIVFKVDAPKDRVQRLHELTLKNCPVGILFEKAGVKINYSLRTVKE